jgi:uncharacterized membrane protein
VPLAPQTSPQSFSQSLRTTLLSGLAVLVPLGLTVYVLQFIVSTADRIVDALPRPLAELVPQRFPGAGLLIAVVVTLTAGILARNLIGRRIMTALTRLIERIPLVAAVYKPFRQISETFLSSSGSGFKRVVLVEWPRRGTWTLAFVTGETRGQIAASLQGAPVVATEARGAARRWLNLFVPTTPNPTSGFYFIADEAECLATDLTIEGAFKAIISAGALPPDAAPVTRAPP